MGSHYAANMRLKIAGKMREARANIGTELERRISASLVEILRIEFRDTVRRSVSL
jgi:hypothetical protein